MPSDTLHLAVGLDGAGWHPAAASEGHPDLTDAQLWIDTAVEAERGLLDFVTIEEVPAGDGPRLDAVLLASRVAAHTDHIGLVPTVSAENADAFHLASAIAVLDHVSGGRGGVHLRVGPDAVSGYAAELRRIWDGLDESVGRAPVRLVDAAELHLISYPGERFSVLGPATTPAPPQGRPLVLTGTEHDTALRVEEAREFVDLLVYLDITASAAKARADQLDHIARSPYRPSAETFVGTPTQLADRLVADRRDVRLLPASSYIDLPLITRQLVPELQRRGAFRTGYDGDLQSRLGLASAVAQRDAVPQRQLSVAG